METWDALIHMQKLKIRSIGVSKCPLGSALGSFETTWTSPSDRDAMKYQDLEVVIVGLKKHKIYIRYTYMIDLYYYTYILYYI